MGNEKEYLKKGFFPESIFGNENKKKFPDIMESIIRENNIFSSKKLTNEEKIKITVEFIEAIINKNYDLMVECFGNGADINYKMERKEATPIFYAIRDYDEKIFNFLVRNGADVNVQNEDGESPILYFLRRTSNENCLEKYVQLCKGINLLIEHNANVNKKNKYEKCALSYAIEGIYNPKKIIELLIKNGANVNEIDSDNISPLMYAAQKCNVDVIELLRDHGAFIDCIDREGCDAIDYAIKGNGIDVVKTLLEINKFKFKEHICRGDNEILYRPYWVNTYKKNITCNEKGYKLQDGEGNTYLMNALKRNGYHEMFEFILSYFDYEEYLTLKHFKTGRNILHEAVICEKKEIVELLISKKMNLNEQDGTGSMGYTALMHACKNGDNKSIEIANLLIDAGADVTLINYEKESALSLVSKRITFELNKKWNINPKLIELYGRLNGKLNEMLEYRKNNEEPEEFTEKNNELPF